MDELVRIGAAHGLYTSTSTNAHFLRPERCAQIVQSGLSRLIISIDGMTQDTYASYRVGGQLDKVLEGTRNMVEARRAYGGRGPHLVWQFLVVGPNEHEVGTVKQHAQRSVWMSGHQDSADRSAGRRTPPADRIPRAAPLRPQSRREWSLRNPLADECWRMWHGCVMTWDGKVVPCCFDKDAHHTMGSVGEQAFKDIWFSPEYEAFRGRFSPTGPPWRCAKIVPKAATPTLECEVTCGHGGRRTLKWTQWIAPLLIGTVAAGAVVWFGAHHEVSDPQTGEATTSWALLQQFEWSRRSTWALLGVIACVLVRDIGYIVRLRILSFQSFSWRQATENILLWELSSALTPSVVGGSAVAVVILKRDGLRWGKSLATVFATALMDEAFYLVAVPLVFLLASFVGQSVFPEGSNRPRGDRSSGWPTRS